MQTKQSNPIDADRRFAELFDLIRLLEQLEGANQGRTPCPHCGGFHDSHLGKDGAYVSIDPIDFTKHGDPELAQLITEYKDAPRIHWCNDDASCAYQPYHDTVTITEPDIIKRRILDGGAEEGISVENINDQIRRLVLHELSHSTGNKKRLNREVVGLKGAITTREQSLEEVIAERAAQIVLKEKGWLTPELKKTGDKYIAKEARLFERFEGMTLGEVRLEAEPFAIAAAEHILGRKLMLRQIKVAKLKAKAKPKREAVAA